MPLGEDFGVHAGWLSEREAIGEMCLLSAGIRRAATVVAGDNGVELITLERSTFNHLADRARHDVRHYVPQKTVFCRNGRAESHPYERKQTESVVATE